MKVKSLNLAITASLALMCAGAYADSSTDQLNQLQAQIDQLKAQVNGKGTLGQLVSQSAGNSSSGFTDANTPFGALPDTGIAYTLLSEQSTFSAPFVIGGLVESDLQAWRGDAITNTSSGSYENGTGLYLTAANLYLLANLNSWTQAFMTVKGGVVSGQTTEISNAFLNFGNLKESPVYVTLGKTYVPFGVFSGNAQWSNTLLTNAFRSGQVTQADLGFAMNGLNTSVSVFSPSGYSNNISTFSANAQYGANYNAVTYSYGVGYIDDIRGTSSGVGNAFAQNGAATTVNSPFQGKKVGAYDLNALLGYQLSSDQKLGLNGEWISTTGGNVTVNGLSVPQMQAWNVTGTYTPVLLGADTMFALSYSATKNMQNVPLPLSGNAGSTTANVVTGVKNQWLAFASRQVVKNVYVGPEYQKAKLYNGQSTWSATVDVTAYF